jgi:predicted nucleic acid-binding protein
MDQDAAMRQALNRLSEYNLEQLIPRQFALTETTSYILKLHLDPYDAVMLSTAIDSDMDAIISRDAKLAAKAAEFVPVLSPEEFLAKVSG